MANVVNSDISKNTIPAPTGDGFEYYDDIFTDPDTGEVKTKLFRVNVYEMIQAASKTCDMNYIIACLKKGDTSVLEESQGMFIDATQLPQDLNEAIELKEKALALFENNEDLKAIYKDSESYEKDLFAGVDIVSKVYQYRISKIEALKKEKTTEIKSEEK